MLKTAKKPVKKVTKTPAKAVTKRVVKTVKPFRPSSIKLVRGNDLAFNDSIFQPMATGREIDTILSTEGGLMPGTNMVLVGGPGSGKTTVALDWIASLTHKGFKCLYVSAEMDEIAHYKYCKFIDGAA